MAVDNINVTCDGASGTAAAFVTSVQVNGIEVSQESVTGQPVPRTGGVPWSWQVSWSFEGEQSVVIYDVTNDGAATHYVGEFPVSCPLPSTVPETTTTAPSVSPEPLASVPQLVVDAGTSTSVALDLAPVPTVATTVQVAVPVTLPATGAASGPLVGLGAAFVLAGMAALRVRRMRW